MERSLTASEELLDALPLPYVALRTIDDQAPTSDLCVFWMNASARRRFGDVVGRRVLRDQPLGDIDDLAPTIRSTDHGRTIDSVVSRGGRHESRRFHVEPLSSGWAVLIEDIDTEVRTRDALTASSDALARVQRWGHVGVWDLNVATGALYWSSQVHDLLGLDQSGLEAFRSAVHPEDVALIDHLLARVLAQPGPYRATHRIIRDGEVRTLDQHVQSVADDHGRPVRLIGTMVDVTEVQALRDQLLQAERARMIGVVAAGVAHDFNNLLTVVEGHASLLLTQTEDDGMRSGLEAIRRAASQASKTTRKLMSLGRQESIRCGPVALESLFADVAGWIRPTAPEVTVVEDVRAPGLVAVADEAVLRQALLDLVLNACDAQATSVRLVADEVTLDSTSLAVSSGDVRAGDHIRIDVADDGTGMDCTTRDRALEPFFSTKSHDGGSGLGLATASTNVTKMNGHLTIATEPGLGTTISIFLPPPDRPPQKRRPRRRPRANRIAVACADSAQGERARTLVADQGHQVVVVSDLQALAFCLASEPIDATIVQAGLAADGEWPDELLGCPTIWMEELDSTESQRRIRARLAEVLPQD